MVGTHSDLGRCLSRSSGRRSGSRSSGCCRCSLAVLEDGSLEVFGDGTDTRGKVGFSERVLVIEPKCSLLTDTEIHCDTFQSLRVGTESDFKFLSVDWDPNLRQR
jgi:hypothetical protein